MGLPGAGETTLATSLAPLLNAVVFNADAVRANLSRDLTFSLQDRIEHARRMGWMCDRVVEAGGTVIADFICPTVETRAVFGEAFIIWVDRIEAGCFQDTNRMFAPPATFDLRVEPEWYTPILGRTGAGAFAASLRSAETHGSVYWKVPAVSFRASAFD
jgi:hypothetical protein